MNLSFWKSERSIFPRGTSSISSSDRAMNVLQVCSLQLDFGLSGLLAVRLCVAASCSSSSSHAFSMVWWKDTLRHFSIKFFSLVLGRESNCYFVSIVRIIGYKINHLMKVFTNNSNNARTHQLRKLNVNNYFPQPWFPHCHSPPLLCCFIFLFVSKT